VKKEAFVVDRLLVFVDGSGSASGKGWYDVRVENMVVATYRSRSRAYAHARRIRAAFKVEKVS
jgi:hypothetical protein